jgi:molybdopterin synthase catalytic subunit
MTFDEAIERASRDDAFKATVYAMNSLLIHKGIYTKQEFRQLFTEWVEKEERKKARKNDPANIPESRPRVTA